MLKSLVNVEMLVIRCNGDCAFCSRVIVKSFFLLSLFSRI